MKQLISAIIITLVITTQTMALSSTRQEEHFGEISPSCSSMVECFKMQSINTGNLESTGGQLIMNVYVEAESLGGK